MRKARLKNINTKELSFVHRGANRRKWAIIKSEEGDEEMDRLKELLKAATNSDQEALVKFLTEKCEKNELEEFQDALEAIMKTDEVDASVLDQVGNIVSTLASLSTGLISEIQSTQSKRKTDDTVQDDATDTNHQKDDTPWRGGLHIGKELSFDSLRGMRDQLDTVLKDADMSPEQRALADLSEKISGIEKVVSSLSESPPATRKSVEVPEEVRSLQKQISDLKPLLEAFEKENTQRKSTEDAPNAFSGDSAHRHNKEDGFRWSSIVGGAE